MLLEFVWFGVAGFVDWEIFFFVIWDGWVKSLFHNALAFVCSSSSAAARSGVSRNGFFPLVLV